MILVRAHAARRALASAKDGGPAPGTTVDTTVDIKDNGELDEQATKADGNQAIVEIEGTVVAVSGNTFQVKTEGGLPLTITVPAGMTVNVAVGDDVELKADLQGATLTLVSMDDENDQGDSGSDGSSGSGSSGSD